MEKSKKELLEELMAELKEELIAVKEGTVVNIVEEEGQVKVENVVEPKERVLEKAEKVQAKEDIELMDIFVKEEVVVEDVIVEEVAEEISEKDSGNVHSKQKPHICKEPGCVKRLGEKMNLKVHVRTVHLKEKPYPCKEPGCAKKFGQSGARNLHIRTVHCKEKPYPC